MNKSQSGNTQLLHNTFNKIRIEFYRVYQNVLKEKITKSDTIKDRDNSKLHPVKNVRIKKMYNTLQKLCENNIQFNS